MTNLQPFFTDRTFANILAKPNLAYTVQSFSHSAIGGPKAATIHASGSVNNLFELVEYLRYAVEITDEAGRVCWWGFVHEVEINTGKIRFGVSLDTMCNNAVVVYGDGSVTSEAVDTDSTGEYYVKAMTFTVKTDDNTVATSLRDAILARRKYPIPTIDVDNSEVGATIYCKGWWEIADWRLWVYDFPGEVDTTAMISTIFTFMAASGPFNSVYIDLTDGASNINTAQQNLDYQNTCKQQIEDLLAVGTHHTKRMLLTVDVLRNVHITEEPASSTDDYWIDSDSRITNYIGVTLPTHLVEAGKWLRLRDVVPATADVSKLADPSKVFIEEIEWSEDGTVRITPRDVPLDMDIFKFGEA